MNQVQAQIDALKTAEQLQEGWKERAVATLSRPVPPGEGNELYMNVPQFADEWMSLMDQKFGKPDYEAERNALLSRFLGREWPPVSLMPESPAV